MNLWFNSLRLKARTSAWLLVLALQATNLYAQTDSAIRFEFTKLDLQVLAEVDEADRQLAKKGLLFQDAELDHYLNKIGTRVIGDRPIPENVNFRFYVLRDPTVNAFALPNGSVYVTTGLLSVLQDEAQLAAVLGHETAHVFERHTYLKIRSDRKKNLAMNIVGGVSSVVPFGGFTTGVFVATTSIKLAGIVSSGVLEASIFGYSREMERQADSDGLNAMISSSYDPAAMAQSFERIDQSSRLEFEPVQGFYQDHPTLSDRRTAALQFASAHHVAMPIAVSQADYLAKVSPAICYNIEADIDSRRTRSAVAQATQLTQAAPDEPKYQVLLGDAYRALGAQTPVASEYELNQHGQDEHRREYFRMTQQEEQKQLLQRPGGEATLRNNLDHAEKLYLAAMQKAPNFAAAYRSLGFLYEQQAKYPESATQYHRYLDLVSGTSIDRLRIERRLASVEKLAALHIAEHQESRP